MNKDSNGQEESVTASLNFHEIAWIFFKSLLQRLNLHFWLHEKQNKTKILSQTPSFGWSLSFFFPKQWMINILPLHPKAVFTYQTLRFSWADLDLGIEQLAKICFLSLYSYCLISLYNIFQSFSDGLITENMCTLNLSTHYKHRKCCFFIAWSNRS